MQDHVARSRYTLGKYRLLAELGNGGMGVIYLAVAAGPAGFTKLVVLKALHPNMTEDPAFVGMFLDEARLAARLNHPNVVQTYEVSEEGGRPIITMEYLEGQTLAQILSRERRNRARPHLAAHVRILIEALAGLHYAHELNDFNGSPLKIVHRDASPQNIFVTYEGQIKVLDFGIAKAATSSMQTTTGMLKGKPRYMSPEQLGGLPVDRRADLFSVGVILWEVLAGERILKDLNEVEAMGRMLQGFIPPPSSVNPAVPPALEAVCLRALAADREARYPTALAMQTDLERALAELGEAITSREVGKHVAELFAEEQARRHLMVEECLSRPTDPFNSMLPLLGATSPSMSVASFTRAGWNTPTMSQPQAPPRASRSMVALVLALAGIAAALGVGLWLRPVERAAPAPAAAAASSLAVAAPPPAAPAPAPSAAAGPDAHGEREALVSISITVQPEGAKLFFDDAQLTVNPFRGTMRKDSSPHYVRAEARGYVGKTVAIVLDRAQDVVIALEKQAPGPAHPPRPPPAVAPPKPAAPERQAPPAAPRPNRTLDASNPWDD